jgi:hypothetical protein
MDNYECPLIFLSELISGRDQRPRPDGEAGNALRLAVRDVGATCLPRARRGQPPKRRSLRRISYS